jgi:5-methylcytosine-specific restriction endonuclease McrA
VPRIFTAAHRRALSVAHLGLVPHNKGKAKRRIGRICDVVTRKCRKCGATFQTKVKNILRGGGRFCSKKCGTTCRKYATSQERFRVYHARHREQRRLDSRLRMRKKRRNRAFRLLANLKTLEWRRLNPERARAAVNEWIKRNPIRVRVLTARRRARTTGKRFYAKDLEGLRELFPNCAYCRDPLNGVFDVDHVIPVSQGGHPTAKSNLVLACPKCNGRKHARTPHQWQPAKFPKKCDALWLLKFSKRRFTKPQVKAAA